MTDKNGACKRIPLRNWKQQEGVRRIARFTDTLWPETVLQKDVP